MLEDSRHKKLIEEIQKNRTAIFCGAGISANSGIPLANSLTEHILQLFEVDSVDISLLQQSKLPFEAFIQTLIDETKIDDLLDIFSQGEPNATHEFIAELVKGGFLTTIMTTNFDLFIEKALENLGLQRGMHFIVYSTEGEFSKIVWADNSICKIIKIHGCVSDKKTMAITLGEVAKKTISQNRARAIDSFFSSEINPSVAVMGYSCSDVFDISPQIEQIEHKSSIFFIDHAFDNELLIENVGLKEANNPFYDFHGYRFWINTDFLIENLGHKVLNKEFVLKKKRTNWKQNVEHWIEDCAKYSQGFKHHVVGRLLYDIGKFERAVNIWNKGTIIAQQEKNQLFFYSLLGNLGMAYNALGQYNLAKSCLEQSVDACEQIGNTQGVIAQSQALGNIYRNLGNYENAISMFNKAIALAEKYNPSSYCSSLGNLALVYNLISAPDKTIEILNKGLSYALVLGEKQYEGSMLCTLGVAYFQKGDYGNAVHFIDKSLSVTRSIGDKQGECMALINFANVTFGTNQYEDCLNYAQAALEIASEINMIQSEATAYYLIGSVYFFKKDRNAAINYLEKAFSIFENIYGLQHSHTISAEKYLQLAQKMA